MDITPDYNFAPRSHFFSLPKFHDSMERCFECATSCWISADAFIGERNEDQLSEAIRLCLECAEVCARTVKMLVALTQHSKEKLNQQLDQCIEACLSSAKEASLHCGDHEHCLICVKSCEDCVRACEKAKMDLEIESSTNHEIQI